MKATPSLVASILAVLPLVSAHGIVTSPPIRTAGTAFGQVCSAQVLSQEKSNPQGNVQAELQVATQQKDYDPTKCAMTLCKGYQFADNSANVQSYTAGQTVNFKAIISAPHTGVMNVSVVNAQTNTPIGDPLIYYSDYASNAHTIPANNTAFSVTMPDVSSQCGTAGTCVLQWWWNAADINQTYESCVDFTMGGSGSSSGTTGASASAAAPGSTSAAAGTATSSVAAVANVQAVETHCAEAMNGEQFTRRHARDFSA